MKPLPHVLAPESLSKEPLKHLPRRTPELRKMATFWKVANASKLPASECEAALKRAWSDEAAARAVAASLTADARSVLEVFRRHGGAVHGEVLRLDLLARGV